MVECAVDEPCRLECGVGVFAALVAVAVANGSVHPQFDGCVDNGVVRSREAEVFLPTQRLTAAEDTSVSGEPFAGGARLVVGIAPCECGTELFLHVLVFVFGGDVCAHLLGRPQPLRLVGRTPVTLLPRAAVFVHVVGVGECGDACVVGVVETKETGEIAVVGANASLGVDECATIVFAFQFHVHHVVFFAHFLALPATILRRLVVDLHILHRIVGQVVEHYFVVAFEEVLSIERQVVHLLPVHVDVAIVFQFCTGHLTHQSVEHRAFGQVEGGGVVDHGVTPIGNFYLRSRDDHTLEIAFSEDVVFFHFLLQEQSWHLEVTVSGEILHVVVDISSVIAFAFGFDDETVLLARNAEFVIAVAKPPLPHPACCGIYNGTVAVHQRDVCLQRGLGERVVDSSVKAQ